MVRPEVLVKLAAPDPWSFTVFDALTQKFGLGDVVDVGRIKSWELEFDGEGMDSALDTLKRLLRETALLANPNRDIWVIRQSRTGLPAGFWFESTDAAQAFVVKVTDVEDIPGASITNILRCRLGIRQIRNVRFSTIWGLKVSRANCDPSGLAARIAVARHRRSGLLANPHSQTARVYAARDYLTMETT